jgi:diguanylate cyclase (GGDEF)-like protein
MKEISVTSFMTTAFKLIPPETPIHEIVDFLMEKGHSCALIGRDQKLLGMVTERKLIRQLHEQKASIDLNGSAGQCMTSRVQTLTEKDSLLDVLVVCRTERVRHLPVVKENDELVGLITLTDLANAHFHVTEMHAEMIEKHLAEKTRNLEALNEELQALSMEDHLMQIGNRRAMEVDLDHTHSASLRYRQIYSVLLIDIDFFKKFNDRYGHQGGDDALVEVAKIIKLNIRASDRLYRYGGEELLVLLPQTTAEQSKVVASKLTTSIHDANINHCESLLARLTISSGSACIEQKGELLDSSQKLVELADEALYSAKGNGRNQFVVIAA